jgi:putative heme-binding domain-containing protein
VPELIGAAATPADRVLEHSLIYALIEIGDPASTAAAGQQVTTSQSRRAALMALDQMNGGHLKPDEVIPLLDSSDAVLRETAWWIAARHPDWGDALAGFFKARLAAPAASAAVRDDLQQQLAQFAGQGAIQQLLATTVASDLSTDARLIALRAMATAGSSSVPASARVKELPAGWTAAVSRALMSADDEVSRHAVSVARAVPAGKDAIPELQVALLRVARDRTRAADVRVQALTALAGGTRLDAESFDLLRACLGPSSPAALRAASATVVEKARFDRPQLLGLVPLLEVAGPLELPRILHAFDSARDEEIGLALVAALGRSRARSTLRADTLRPRLANYPETVKQAGEALLASVHVDSGKQARRLEELLAAVQGGDVARGQTVFNGARAACLSCHAIGYIGGRIGPDLTKIGQVRSERDLLEAVVFPSVSFARGYESVTVKTRSGELHSGALRSDVPEEVVLSTVTGTEVRIPRKDVAEMEPGTISLMPSGYGELLTRQELADLLAFLKAAR